MESGKEENLYTTYFCDGTFMTNASFFNDCAFEKFLSTQMSFSLRDEQILNHKKHPRTFYQNELKRI